jgi:hypothetical protein
VNFRNVLKRNAKRPNNKLIAQSKGAVTSRKIKQESDLLISRFEGLTIRVSKERADILGCQAGIGENRLLKVGSRAGILGRMRRRWNNGNEAD